MGSPPNAVNGVLTAIPGKTQLTSLDTELFDLPEWPAGPRREENIRERYARKDAQELTGARQATLTRPRRRKSSAALGTT